MDEQRAKEIWKKYLEKTCSEEEKLMMELWFAQQFSNDTWNWEDVEERHLTADQLKVRLETFLDQLEEAPGVEEKGINSSKAWFRWGAIAASIVLVCAVALYFRLPGLQEHPLVYKAKDVPERDSLDQPLLILADGTDIALDAIERGEKYAGNQLSVHKVKEDELVFGQDAAAAKNRQTSGMNKLIVPKGRDFKLTLSDGTKVWVNAGSTLSYSTGFGTADREICLDGEAYFDVAKNVDLPFIVKTNQLHVEVLGTSFNVNAYNDEGKIITTVESGSVRVGNESERKVVKPNQQLTAFVSSGHKMMVNEVNAEDILAWREGYFVFDQQDITSIMKHVARWYDVDISFEGPVSTETFGGTFSKKKSLAELLRKLETLGNFHFRQIGRRVIVMS